MAKATALDFQGSGLAVELRIDQATAAHFEREAEEGCDLLIYYSAGVALPARRQRRRKAW